MSVSTAMERVITTIPTIERRQYELFAHSLAAPAASDAYTKGSRQFLSVVRIDATQSGEAKVWRHATRASLSGAGDATDLAIQFGQDFVDGKVQASRL